jgi:solute:Na+ symporter, SSS family
MQTTTGSSSPLLRHHRLRRLVVRPPAEGHHRLLPRRRNAGWITIGASIFTSNIGSEHIVGLAGQGAATGMAMAHWELHAWVLIMLAGLFVPFYYKSGVETIPQFLENASAPAPAGSSPGLAGRLHLHQGQRHGLCRRDRLPGAAARDQPDHRRRGYLDAFWIGAFTTVIITGLYTVFGGMRAIMATATPQAVIILFGSFVITASASPASAAVRASPPVGANWSPPARPTPTTSPSGARLSDPDFPWLGVLIASPIIGIWYWCTDQYIVQRTLTAKDLATARRGALFGGLLKVWPVLIFLIPGMIGWTLDQKFNRGAEDPLLTAQYSTGHFQTGKGCRRSGRECPPA